MGAPFNVLSYGENHYKANFNERCNCKGESVHAEHHAIQKIPLPQKKLRHLKKLDLLVIRVNRSGSLGNSKPCLHCLYMLSQRLPEKGYCISKVYYSGENGEIMQATLQTLLYKDTPHVSKFYQNHPTKITTRMMKKTNMH